MSHQYSKNEKKKHSQNHFQSIGNENSQDLTENSSHELSDYLEVNGQFQNQEYLSSASKKIKKVRKQFNSSKKSIPTTDCSGLDLESQSIFSTQKKRKNSQNVDPSSTVQIRKLSNSDKKIKAKPRNRIFNLDDQQFQAQKNHLKNHSFLPEDRLQIMDALVGVVHELQLPEICFFQTIALVDRFLAKSTQDIDKYNIQLVYLSGLYLVNKYESRNYDYDINTLVQLCNNKYTIQEFIDMEGQILQTTNCNIDIIELFSVNEIIFQNINFQKFNLNLIHKKFLLKQTLYFCKQLLSYYDVVQEYNYSQMVTAAFYLSCKMLQQVYPQFNLQKVLQNIIQFTTADQQQLIKIAEIVQERSSDELHQKIKSSYKEEFEKLVSNITQ